MFYSLIITNQTMKKCPNGSFVVYFFTFLNDLLYIFNPVLEHKACPKQNLLQATKYMKLHSYPNGQVKKISLFLPI